GGRAQRAAQHDRVRAATVIQSRAETGRGAVPTDGKRHMADVVVVGGCNMDLIAHTQRLPRPGETVLGDRFLTAPGGKGSNQAVAAARLGASVSLIGRVGADDFGSRLRQMLRDEGVDVRHLLVDAEGPSGVALITVDERGEK